MSINKYIKTTNSNSYKYRRKVPSQLKNYLQKREIIKSLGKNLAEAMRKADDYNRIIDEAIEVVSIKAIPDNVKLDLISEKLSPLMTITTNIESKRDQLIQVAEDYLKSLSVSKEEVRDRSYILLKVFPSAFHVLFKNLNPQVKSINYNQLVKIRDLLQKLPKRNIEKYRAFDMYTLMKGIQEGSIKTKQEELISITTINKYIKWFNALMSFAVKHKLIPYNPIVSGLTIKKHSISRNERKVFTKEELDLIEEGLKDSPIFPIIEVLRYTGMRLSEIYKYQIKLIDNVLCFDLREPKEGATLKTLSSYRVIPVHNKLKKYIQELPCLLDKMSSGYISKRFKKDIDRLLENTEDKSLYSLRHTFATTLIAKDTKPEVVSELMGHAHTTMTLNRYVKGFPVAVLKKAINEL